jgi:hypothetical protein
LRLFPLIILTLIPPVIAMSETAPREPVLGINPHDTSYDAVVRAMDSQRWIIAVADPPVEEPKESYGLRFCEFGVERIAVHLSNYEAARVVHLSYSFTAEVNTEAAVAHLEAEYERICGGFEEILGPGARSGTGPVFGCYWTGTDDESYVEYHPPGEGGAMLTAEIFFDRP